MPIKAYIAKIGKNVILLLSQFYLLFQNLQLDQCNAPASLYEAGWLDFIKC